VVAPSVIGMVEVAEVRRWVTALASSSAPADAVAVIDLIGSLEDLKNAAAAVQAEAAAALHAMRSAQDETRGVPVARRARGVAAEVALARRESVHRGNQHLALARTLREMPHTGAAFRAGRISEWRSQVLLRETACLSREDRAAVDATLASDHERLAGLSEGETIGQARDQAYRLDPRSFVERRRRAEVDRRVTLRPAPDVMSQLSALLPVRDGVAVHAVLRAAADAAVAAGDPRSRGQVMADTLVARVTGAGERDGAAPAVTVTIDVVVPDTVLTRGSAEPGFVDGFGPVPADLAREIARDATWWRRLYATPATGALVAMDSTRRLFPDGLRRFLRLRDRWCRMPWCDAPVRHGDHVVAAEDGGPTSAANGQGLCEAHNHARQAHGWAARPRPGPHHTVETTTPTGHRYTSQAPRARPASRPGAGAGRRVGALDLCFTLDPGYPRAA